MTVYSPTDVPSIKGAGLSAELTNIESTSKIDVLRLLGRAASKIIIEVQASQTVSIVLNSALRKTVPFKVGVVDINGETSTLPEFGYGEVDSTTGLTIATLGADNVTDRQTNLWGGKPGSLTIDVADGSQVGATTWNSHDSYGELPITSLEITHSGGTANISCMFIV